MASVRRVVIDRDSDLHASQFSLVVGADSQQARVALRRLRGGVSDGVDVLSVQTPRALVELLPTRGMSLWRAVLDGVTLGWRSPLGKPVHPRHVNVAEASGFGFLDGPTELMFRCGLGNAGTPDFDRDGRLAYPLHGRIANLPAEYVAVEIDDPETRVTVIGKVTERRFLRDKLLLTTRVTIPLDRPVIEVEDAVTNLSARAATMQMIYHVNLGEPFLHEGSTIHAPVTRVCPRDGAAAEAGIEGWNRMPAPDANSWEQVYFADLAGDADGRTQVVVSRPDGESAIGLAYNFRELPCFTLWRNTQAPEDGYVVGVEPGTNFPNPRSFEEAAGRFVSLDAHGEWRTSLRLGAYVGKESVERAIAAVEELRDGRSPELSPMPCPRWSPAEGV